MPSWNYTWYDASGNAFALQKPPVYTVIYRSFAGGYAPNFTPVVEYLPLTPGNYMKYVNTDVTEVDLILLVQGTSPENLWNNMQGLNYTFSPLRSGSTGSRASSYLRVTTPNNNKRRLYCICQSDFSLNPSTYNETSVQVPLHFYAQDPYWYSTSSETVSYYPTSTSYGIKWFFGGKKQPGGSILPVQLGLGDGYWNATFNIPDTSTNLPVVGEVSVYPTWTISGPTGNTIILTNTTTGLSFTISDSSNLLQYGEYLTINMRNRTVMKNGNTNMLKYVSFNSSFWPLDPGGNNIVVNIASKASKYTQVSINWFPAYLGVV